MAEDLSLLAQVPTDQLTRLISALQEQAGFISEKGLVQLIEQFVPDETHGAATFNALQNLRQDSTPQVLETLHNWRNASEKNKARLSDDAYSALQEKLETLIRDYPALKRMRKANTLRSMLGNEVQGFIFVCDLRPVYKDPKKDDIEGLIPLVTLKVFYERQNMLTEEVELLLTSEQLEGLIFRATEAKKKLDVLCDKVIQWLPEGLVKEEG